MAPLPRAQQAPADQLALRLGASQDVEAPDQPASYAESGTYQVSSALPWNGSSGPPSAIDTQAANAAAEEDEDDPRAGACCCLCELDPDDGACVRRTNICLDYIGDEILEFLADFFGAMQFDGGDDETQEKVKAACKKGDKKLKMQRVKRKAPAKAKAGAKKKKVPPAPGTSLPGAPSEDLEISPVKAFNAKDEEDSEDDGDLEEMFEVLSQAFPLVTFMQAAVAFLLWFGGNYFSGEELAGLESIWPRSTDLTINEDCNDKRWELWRWWTYQFSHVGISHVGFNCMIVIIFGVALEGFHGQTRMFLMFQIGVFGGACCYWMWDVHTRVVGMSGGCFALMGIYFAHCIMNGEIAYRTQKFIAIIVMIFLGLLPAFMDSGKDGVSHSAHVGGLIAGLISGIVIGKNKRVIHGERTFQVISLIVGILLVIMAIGWLLGWPPKGIFDDESWCWDRQIADEEAFGDRLWHCVRCNSKECAAKWSQSANVAHVSAAACEQRAEGWRISER